MAHLRSILLVSLLLVFIFTSLVRVARAADPFPNCRLGVGGAEASVTGYDLAQLNIGTYLDWSSRSSLPPGLPANIQHLQTVRVHQKKTDSDWQGGGAYLQPPAYSVSPSLNALSNLATSRPGSIWLIGNEVDRRDWFGSGAWRGQDEMTPELYATAFHDIQAVIKAADPTAKVAIGSVVEATPLRLKYLNRVWNSYQSQYGYSMGQDIDLWNIHGFILREVPGTWGAETPAGLNDPAGFLSGANNATVVAAHHNIAYFQEFTRNLRQWMADHGERNKPLINSEYGVLYKTIGGQTITDAQVNAYLTASFDYLFSATDPNIGYPADENRLVQHWVWYSVQDQGWNGNLFNPSTKALTTFGNTWKSYVTNANKPLASLPQRNLLVTNLETIPDPVAAPPGQVTLRADIANSGNTWTNTGNNVVIRFWNGPPGGAGSTLIGSKTLRDLPGCGQLTPVEIQWTHLQPGVYTWYVQAVPLSEETRSDDNVASGTVEVFEADQADLALTQIDAPDPVLVGSSLVYTTTITNLGPDPATGISLTQALTGSFTLSQITPSQGTCTGTGPLSCNLGSLANGAVATVRTVVTPTGGGTLTHLAQVSSAVYDPNTLNNSASSSTSVSAPILRFSAANYTADEDSDSALITVTRTGQSGGPISVNYATANGTATAGLDYTSTSGTLTWAAGELSSKSFTVSLLDDNTSEVSETVHLSLSSPSGGASLGTPQTATLTLTDNDTPPVAQADLSVSKSDGSDPVRVGSRLTYTIRITNVGPDVATAVALADPLSDTVTFAAVATTKGSCTGTSLVTCNFDTLVPNAAVTVTLAVTPTQAGALTNAVNVSGNEADPNSANNSAFATTLVTAPVLRFSASSYMAAENGAVAVITVSRSGQSGLPVTVNYATRDGAATAGEDYSATAGTLSWSVGDLSSKTFTVAILEDSKPEADETVQLTLSNPAGASLGAPSAAVLTITDNDPLPDTQADLSVSKFASSESAPVGSRLTYTIQITNSGPDIATGVSLVEPLPGAVTLASVSTTQGACSGSSTITCSLGTLTQHERVTITLAVTPTEAGEFTNTVHVTGNEPDPQLANNTATAYSRVTAPTLQFSSATYSVEEGSPQALITVTRLGPSGGPLTVNYSTTNGTATAGADYTAASGLLSWEAGDLLPKTFVVAILEDGEVEGTETVQLVLTGPGSALLGSPKFALLTLTDNDTGSSSEADLRVTSAASPNPVLVGDPLVYTIQVTNQGPDVATGATLFNDLPQDVTLVSATLTQGSCSETALIICNLNALAPNGTVTLKITVMPAKVGTITSVVQVSGTEFDPELGNNAAAVTSTITAQGLIRVQKYHDQNGNGQKDGGEPGLNQWTTILYNDQDELISSRTTHSLNGEMGWIHFNNLPPGAYKICELLPAPSTWVNSDPGGGALCKSTSLTSSTAEKLVRLGNYKYGSLTVIKDAPLAHIFQFTGSLPAFSLTSNSTHKSRLFDQLPPGRYLIAENRLSIPSPSWFLQNVSCKNNHHQPISPTLDLPNFRATIPLLSGQDLTCTFYNRLKQASQAPQMIYLPLLLHQ